MDNAASTPQVQDCAETDFNEVAADSVDSADSTVEARVAPRFTLLIRAAKLVTPQGEFVCVIRDVSETGISVRLFHKLPHGNPIELHMPGGGVYELQTVWDRDNEAGFEFGEQVDVERLINEAGSYPKRGLRLGVYFPIKVSSLTQSCEAVVENLSQQGARFEADGDPEKHFAIDQNLRVESLDGGAELQDVRAKVRWRRDQMYGIVFEDTMSLRDFARLAARMQCPILLD